MLVFFLEEKRWPSFWCIWLSAYTTSRFLDSEVTQIHTVTAFVTSPKMLGDISWYSLLNGGTLIQLIGQRAVSSCIISWWLVSWASENRNVKSHWMHCIGWRSSAWHLPGVDRRNWANGLRCIKPLVNSAINMNKLTIVAIDCRIFAATVVCIVCVMHWFAKFEFIDFSLTNLPFP